jgi:hypothetical protein
MLLDWNSSGRVSLATCSMLTAARSTATGRIDVAPGLKVKNIAKYGVFLADSVLIRRCMGMASTMSWTLLVFACSHGGGGGTHAVNMGEELPHEHAHGLSVLFQTALVLVRHLEDGS